MTPGALVLLLSEVTGNPRLQGWLKPLVISYHAISLIFIKCQVIKRKTHNSIMLAFTEICQSTPLSTAFCLEGPASNLLTTIGSIIKLLNRG